MIRIIFTTLILTFSHSLLLSQNSIQTAANRLANIPALRHGFLGFAAYDVNTGQLIASVNADKGFPPASTLKLLTTATALQMLGEGYRFKTELQYDGEIASDGTLKGNLYIKGFGDPTLGSSDMEGAENLEELLLLFQQEVSKTGIRGIEGRVVGDGSYFETAAAGRNWYWSDLGNYYAGGAWALSIHENLYYLNFQQTPSIGRQPRIHSVTPEVPGITFVNELRSAGRNTGDNAYIYGSPYTTTRFVRGTIPAGNILFKIKGSIPDPPYFMAWHFQNNLEECGINATEPCTTQLGLKDKKRSRTTIYTHYSPSLTDISLRANYKSVNHYCENILKTLGQKKYEEGTTESGIKAIKVHWKERGVNTAGFRIEDGSGLSAVNSMTPGQMAGVLSKIGRDKKLFESFYSTIPVAGRSGTVKYMLKNTPAAGKVRLKSGTLERIRNYAGYVETRSGKLLAFAVFGYNYSGKSYPLRSEIERLILAMYNY